MRDQKIALISDIHGNSWALQAVLADCEKNSIDTIINLGDSLFGPLDPSGTFQLLEENNVISISGNQDRYIIENMKEEMMNFTLNHVLNETSDKAIDWLKNLPFDFVFQNDIYCCHGTPSSDTNYLLEKLEKDNVRVKTDFLIEDELKSVEQDVVLCAHSHVQRFVDTGRKLVINPGSVGLAAYDDEEPIPHKMENYSPKARYTIISIQNDAININQVALRYEFELAANTAERNGRKDWAKWIREGRV